MASFPAARWFTGVQAPSRAEIDIADLEIVGTIPSELDGAFFRVAGDHQFPPRFENDAAFN